MKGQTALQPARATLLQRLMGVRAPSRILQTDIQKQNCSVYLGETRSLSLVRTGQWTLGNC